MGTCSCKNFFTTPYPLTTIHPLQTIGQTQKQTDRWTTTMPIARPLLKYGRLKMLIAFVNFSICVVTEITFLIGAFTTLTFHKVV